MSIIFKHNFRNNTTNNTSLDDDEITNILNTLTTLGNKTSTNEANIINTTSNLNNNYYNKTQIEDKIAVDINKIIKTNNSSAAYMDEIKSSSGKITINNHIGDWNGSYYIPNTFKTDENKYLTIKYNEVPATTSTYGVLRNDQLSSFDNTLQTHHFINNGIKAFSFRHDANNIIFHPPGNNTGWLHNNGELKNYYYTIAISQNEAKFYIHDFNISLKMSGPFIHTLNGDFTINDDINFFINIGAALTSTSYIEIMENPIFSLAGYSYLLNNTYTEPDLSNIMSNYYNKTEVEAINASNYTDIYKNEFTKKNDFTDFKTSQENINTFLAGTIDTTNETVATNKNLYDNFKLTQVSTNSTLQNTIDTHKTSSDAKIANLTDDLNTLTTRLNSLITSLGNNEPINENPDENNLVFSMNVIPNSNATGYPAAVSYENTDIILQQGGNWAGGYYTFNGTQYPEHGGFFTTDNKYIIMKAINVSEGSFSLGIVYNDKLLSFSTDLYDYHTGRSNDAIISFRAYGINTNVMTANTEYSIGGYTSPATDKMNYYYMVCINETHLSFFCYSLNFQLRAQADYLHNIPNTRAIHFYTTIGVLLSSEVFLTVMKEPPADLNKINSVYIIN